MAAQRYRAQTSRSRRPSAAVTPVHCADILHNYTPQALGHLVGHGTGLLVYILARLSFLVSVVTLFPLMVSRAAFCRS